MNAFEEYCFGNDYILRFYRVDHGLICTINESMVAELRAVEAKINQQQAEIEELKTKMSLNSYDDAKNVANQLLQSDNEPVAWMSTSGNNFVSKKAPSYVKLGTNDWIPLYTHPSKEGVLDSHSYILGFADGKESRFKTLSKEEITTIWQTDECYQNAQAFANAILRKAQEK